MVPVHGGPWRNCPRLRDRRRACRIGNTSLLVWPLGFYLQKETKLLGWRTLNGMPLPIDRPETCWHEFDRPEGYPPVGFSP